MKPDLTTYLGTHVTMIVDRPLGSLHPRFPKDEPYLVNYGYLPGTESGDGHEIDAYLLGVDLPVESAEGIVVAVLIRSDDVEDKLVVAAEGVSPPTPEEVWAQVEFQERYFDSTLMMADVEAIRKDR